jgi:hypothetical protein
MTRLELWLLGALGAIALAAAGYFYGHRDGATAERQAWQHQVDEANARAAKADERYQAGEDGRDQRLTDIAARLAAPPPNPQILIREVKPDASTGLCADRSSDFRLQFNAAAATGFPTAAAALPDAPINRAGVPAP